MIIMVSLLLPSILEIKRSWLEVLNLWSWALFWVKFIWKILVKLSFLGNKKGVLRIIFQTMMMLFILCKWMSIIGHTLWKGWHLQVEKNKLSSLMMILLTILIFLWAKMENVFLLIMQPKKMEKYGLSRIPNKLIRIMKIFNKISLQNY